MIYQWTGSNIAGQTKRVIGVALIAGSFSVGNIIGPQTFQARDAPNYIPAKITVLVTQAAAAVVAIVLFGYYVWANKQKSDAALSTDGIPAEGVSEQHLCENQTDNLNKTFKYVY